MPSALDHVIALPTTGQLSRAGLRDAITRRSTLSLAASESLANFTVVDPATGVVPLHVVQNGTIYEYDPLDTTTVASATCLVSGDATGRRYKTGGITAPWSVLTVGTSAQPVSPSIGDRYLVPTAATGAQWAGKDGKVAIYSRAGWQFADVPIGRGLFAEDTNTRWYRKADGTWTSGFGSVQIGANALNITNILGTNASFVIRVENQTTATAPSSPTAFTAYIVAGSGGAWSGYSVGDVAMCLSNGTWTRRVPQTGDQVFDKNLGYVVQWNGTAWVSSIGSWVGFAISTGVSGGGTIQNNGSTVYSYSDGTAPTRSFRHLQDDDGVSYKSKKTGSLLRVTWTGNISAEAAGAYTIGLARGSDSTCLDWRLFYVSNLGGYTVTFYTLSLNNTDTLTYKVLLFANGNLITGISRRRMTIEEAA